MVALNMVDEAEDRQISVDEKALAQRLGAPWYPRLLVDARDWTN